MIRIGVSNNCPGMLTGRGFAGSALIEIEIDFVKRRMPDTLAGVGVTSGTGSGMEGDMRLQEDMMISSLLLPAQQKICASTWKVSLACCLLVSRHLKDARIMLSLFAGFCSEPNVLKPPSMMMRGVS